MKATFPEMLQASSVVGGGREQLSLERASDAVTGGGPEPAVSPSAPAPQSFRLNRKLQDPGRNPGAILSTLFPRHWSIHHQVL